MIARSASSIVFPGDSDRIAAVAAKAGAGASACAPAPRLFTLKVFLAAAAGIVAGNVLGLAIYLLT
jgi:hypothetical protein